MKTLSIVSNTLAVMVLTTGVALAGGSTTMLGNGNATASPQAVLPVLLACKVAGHPVEFPETIAITNTGYVTAKKGTTLHWAVTQANDKGSYVLAADLKPKTTVFIANGLHNGIEAGAPCKLTKG